MTVIAKYRPATVGDLIAFYVEEFGREPDVMELSWHGVPPAELVAVEGETAAALRAESENGRWVTRPWVA